jgi:PAS domain S-box-containing protein
VILINTKEEIIKVNREFSNLWGYSYGEVKGKSVSMLFPKKEMQTHRTRMKKAVTSNKILDFETVALTKSGEKVPVSIRGSAFITKDGKVEGFVGVFRDISDRKKAEEELKSSEEKYRLLFAGEQDAILLVDAETQRIIDTNDSALHLYGYSRKEILKLCGPDLSAEPEKSRVAIKKIAEQTNQYIDYHTRLHKKKDGTIFPVEISSGNFILQDKKIVSAMIRDISDRQKAKELLLESEKRYRNIIDNSSFGIIVYDESGQCIVANKAVADIIGTTVEEVLSQNFHRLKSWQQSGMLETAKEALASSEKKRKSFHVVSTFGKELWLDCTFIPCHEIEGNYMLCLSEDVSERKQAEEKLTEYRNNLEQMVEERTKELDKQKTALEQKNITLREVIGEIELQKNKITDNCLATINELVMPTLKEFKAKGNSDDKYIDLIMQNLQKITSPFGNAITSRRLKLTPREIEVCNMIEKGFTNKDIANFLNLTIQSIEEYRKRIRKKLKLTNKKVNLTSYLRNITE